MIRMIQFAAALVVAMIASPVTAQTVEYMHTDALGSVVAITNSAGVVIERNQYEPYGSDLTGIKDGPGYTGHVSDAATGLSYMQQRYYAPEIGTFLSVDPVTADGDEGANFNRYWYANNNPYRFTDPDGRFAFPGSSCSLSYCQQQGIARSRSDDFGVAVGKAQFSLRRHKTPKSQRALIKSVGGDVETLESAQETHEAFVGTLIGLASGGGALGRNAASAAEVTAADIVSVNRAFGGTVELTGSAETVIANMAYREGIPAKVATLIRDVAGRHLFNDGNKRTAQALAERMLGPKTPQGLRSVIERVGRGEIRNVEDIQKALGF